MSRLTLFIANKTYSSWSFRPWLAMRMAGIEFDEELVPFSDGGSNPAFLAFSPTGKVPVLRDGDLVIWETLAILEYLAETHPALWPADMSARARARAISSEMHAGFQALRSECPMNMRRPRRAIPVSAAAQADVARITEIWTSALAQSGGPFLYGEFSAADAMFAPVVNRFDVYALTEDAEILAYMERMKALPPYQEWADASRQEPWVVAEEEH
ncbi:glutathione S-transferase family protein [Georhizobium profundi]|uniref:Glutathione S-transferase family protein n=1 Tax=Georhizobium profundi TaxID=2341112 RepID=A0A3S9B135_9HYPH|nr:glutathione S-transferase family protein [Georhizobium profundi]AZN70657.1 glutathione S-transferase family protein [Georhizobium profundi]